MGVEELKVKFVFERGKWNEVKRKWKLKRKTKVGSTSGRAGKVKGLWDQINTWGPAHLFKVGLEIKGGWDVFLKVNKKLFWE